MTMKEPFVDTDVLIRFLTQDDPEKQAAAAALLEKVQTGQLKVMAPDTVIADAVYVLTSPRLYHLPRSQVRDLLAPLVRLPGFLIQNKSAILRALDLYADTSLDFGDALVVASMERNGSVVVYSYDTHFDQIAGIARTEP